MVQNARITISAEEVEAVQMAHWVMDACSPAQWNWDDNMRNQYFENKAHLRNILARWAKKNEVQKSSKTK